MVSGFDGNKVGKQTLTVTYEGLTDTYEIEVKDVVPPENLGDRHKVEVRDGAPSVRVNNKDDVVRATLKQDELDEAYSLLLVSSPYGEGAVPEADRKALQAKDAELGVTPGAWFDVSLYKVSRQGTVKLDEVSAPVKVEGEVPGSLRKDGRTFYLLRVHNGKVANAAEGKGSSLGWETSEFFTYLLAYKDAGSPSSSSAQNAAGGTNAEEATGKTDTAATPNTTNGTNTSNAPTSNAPGTTSVASGASTTGGSTQSAVVPKTRDNTVAALPLGLAVASVMLLLAGGARRRWRDSKQEHTPRS